VISFSGSISPFQPVDNDREFVGIQARGEDRQLFAGDALLTIWLGSLEKPISTMRAAGEAR
jgi:hypothetical protein